MRHMPISPLEPPTPAPATEDVEAADPPTSGLETYPIDSLLIRSEIRAMVDVLRRIDGGFIVLNPDFQRDFVWDQKRQSRLVESVFMRIPLPVFYLAENVDGKLVVVDGLQRLSTFKRFFDGQLTLDLPGSEVDGRVFRDLSPKLKNRFEDGQLTLYLVDPKVPESVRLDIFERVNSGVPLTRQQMRNALYSGVATQLIRELARAPEFSAASGAALMTPKHVSEMGDREAVNRWCAFTLLGWRTYDGRYDDFLANALKQLNQLDGSLLKEKAEQFCRSMKINQAVFGKHAFRKHTGPTESRRPFNLALFDVFSVLLAPYDETRTQVRGEMVRDGFYRLMNDTAFHDSISRGTTSAENVRIRFDRVERMLNGVLDVT
jgi:hypothetical protein